MSALAERFDGEIIEPGDRAYEDARLVWNAMIDRRPGLILRPRGTGDVATAVRFGREEGLEIAVRGGGHSAAGHSTIDDGLLIDLGAMRAIRVDAPRGRAWVQGGCKLIDLDRETSYYGLAVPAGVNWDTGIGGLALGGGYGWLCRRHGMTADNLESAEVVTADGDIVRASPTEDPELYWGLRGGGGNFGIVTWFEFRAHPVPPIVRSLDLLFDAREADAVLSAFREVAAGLDRDTTSFCGLEAAVAGADLPESLVGRPVMTVGFVAVQEAADLEACVRPLLDAARPLVKTPAAMSFRELQRISSDAPGARRRRYWKGHYVNQMSDAFLDAFLADVPDDGPFFGERELVQQGGAIADLDADATAFANRDALFDVLAIGYWDDAAEDDERLAALRRLADRVEPFGTGVYLNNLYDEGEERVRAAFRDGRFERLRALKARMDPDNVFHRNANIPPASAPA